VSRTHLFVIGCERSGTTPLIRLLGSHPNTAMGMERYKFVLRRVRKAGQPELFSPELFEGERFLDFRETDTNLRPPSFDRHYARIERRFRLGEVEVVGDKLLPPDGYATLAVASQFPDARFIFIYRDLLHVASSFNRRARDPDDTRWPARNDHLVALEHWNESFAAADWLAAEIGCERLFVVRPEVLYQPDARLCEAMFDFIGLGMHEAVSENFQRLHDKWHDRQVKSLALDDVEQADLLARLDRSVLDRYDRRVHDQMLEVTGWRRRWNLRQQARSVRRFDDAARRRAAEMGPPRSLLDDAVEASAGSEVGSDPPDVRPDPSSDS
jgi:hypothetical protein